MSVARKSEARLHCDLGGFEGKHVALWGLAFKPTTDDVREAPAFRIIEAVLKGGGTVAATDPQALETSKERLHFMGIKDGVRLTRDLYDACQKADALVLCTEWRQFQSPNVAKLKEVLRGRFVYDGRNIWQRDVFTEAGFEYCGIGRR